MLLSRVADQLYWGSRYLERAEGTARIVRSFTETIVDLPKSVTTTWEPLLAIAGSREQYDEHYTATDERSIVHFLIADHEYPGSVIASITQCRENLRSCREVVPRPAWLVINDLQIAMGARSDAVARRSRARFLDRVLADTQRFEGIVASMMPRDEAYEFFRIGQVIERADMTTRVVGVRAAALAKDTGGAYLDVQWLGILRSLSAMQAFQRTSRTPMDGDSALRFLLHDRTFPRSVAWCAAQLRASIERLPTPARVLRSVDEVDMMLSAIQQSEIDTATLDTTMDEIQRALARVHDALFSAYVQGPTPESEPSPSRNGVGLGEV